MGELTDLFSVYRSGDRENFDRIFAHLYPELKRLAHSRLRGGRRVTLLDTTVLVHEVYLRHLRAGLVDANRRAHFLAYSARVMRSVIVDFVRRQQAARRGGDAVEITLDTERAAGAVPPEDRVADIAEAVEGLARIDERLASVVEMQFFAGFSASEIVGVPGVNECTVRRDFEKARLLLAAELR